MSTPKISKMHSRKWAEEFPLWVMALPGLLSLLIFNYLPMVGLVMAFQRLNLQKGIFSSPFCGFDNFKFLFASTDTAIVIRNTLAYNICFIVINLFLAVFMALLLSEVISRKFAKVVQTIYIMPHFLSWPVVAIIVFAFLSPTNGYLNKVVAALGGPERTNWYMITKPWPYILAVVNIWKGVGYSSIVYLAAISGISQEYYEAAMLDGASKVQQARYITVPHLKTMMTILLIMSIGGIFNGDFGLFYTVPKDSGSLYSVTNVVSTYVYRCMTELSNYGMSTAAGLLQSVVGFILVMFSNWVVNKIEPENALF